MCANVFEKCFRVSLVAVVLEKETTCTLNWRFLSSLVKAQLPQFIYLMNLISDKLIRNKLNLSLNRTNIEPLRRKKGNLLSLSLTFISQNRKGSAHIIHIIYMWSITMLGQRLLSHCAGKIPCLTLTFKFFIPKITSASLANMVKCNVS